eukprot:2564130-Heterocapsa_arctica.AAC.2
MYGAELTNAPGYLSKKVRTSVARAVSGKAQSARRCLARAILVVPGRILEPDIVVTADVVRGLARRMFFTPLAVAGLDKVWQQEVTRLDKKGDPNKGRGKHARGPVAVLVVVLTELDWQERGPDRWIIDGQEFDRRTTSPKLTEQMAIQQATLNVWKRQQAAGETWTDSLEKWTGPSPESS